MYRVVLVTDDLGYLYLGSRRRMQDMYEVPPGVVRHQGTDRLDAPRPVANILGSRVRVLKRGSLDEAFSEYTGFEKSWVHCRGKQWGM